jgi:hypothetical protein
MSKKFKIVCRSCESTVHERIRIDFNECYLYCEKCKTHEVITNYDELLKFHKVLVNEE